MNRGALASTSPRTTPRGRRSLAGTCELRHASTSLGFVVPVAAAVVGGVVFASLVSTGRWYLALGCLLAVPALALIDRYPLAVVILWLVVAPLIAETDDNSTRKVFWLVHRGLPIAPGDGCLRFGNRSDRSSSPETGPGGVHDGGLRRGHVRVHRVHRRGSVTPARIACTTPSSFRCACISSSDCSSRTTRRCGASCLPPSSCSCHSR